MATPGAPDPAAGGRRRGGRFLPPLALMAVIFVLSSFPDLDSGLRFDFLARKIAHALEYALLWWLWLRAFGFRRPAAAALIAIAYAASDEFHQTFVTGRHGSPADVAIDSVGVALAWGLWEIRRRRAAASQPAALGGDQDGLGPIDRAQLPVDVVEVGADGTGGQR